MVDTVDHAEPEVGRPFAAALQGLPDHAFSLVCPLRLAITPARRSPGQPLLSPHDVQLVGSVARETAAVGEKTDMRGPAIASFVEERTQLP